MLEEKQQLEITTGYNQGMQNTSLNICRTLKTTPAPLRSTGKSGYNSQRLTKIGPWRVKKTTFHGFGRNTMLFFIIHFSEMSCVSDANPPPANQTPVLA